MNKNPANTVFDAKRLIGLRFSDEKVQKNKALWPFKLMADKDDRVQICIT
jgi:heat shock 70kDa protein 1/2/6/8